MVGLAPQGEKIGFAVRSRLHTPSNVQSGAVRTPRPACLRRRWAIWQELRHLETGATMQANV